MKKNNWFKRMFLSMAAATAFVVSSDAAKAQDQTQKTPKGNTPKTEYIHNYTEQTLTQEEAIAQKIDKLVQQYESQNPGKQEQANNLRALLTELGKHDISRNNLLALDDAFEFLFVPKEVLDKKGACAAYNQEDKTIELPDGVSIDFTSTNAIIKTLDLLVCANHEGLHRIQDQKGLRPNQNIANPLYAPFFTAEKFCELQTKINDILYESILYEDFPEKVKTNRRNIGGCTFYQNEIKRLQSQGLSPEKAKKTAVTNITRLYYSGLNDIPEGCAEISPKLRSEIASWNNAYNIQALTTTFYKLDGDYSFENSVDQAKDKRLLETLYGYRQQETEESLENFTSEEKDILSDLDSHNKVFYKIIEKYIQEMGLDLDPSYFTDYQKNLTTVGYTFVQTAYPSGTPKTRVFINLPPDWERPLKYFADDFENATDYLNAIRESFLQSFSKNSSFRDAKIVSQILAEPTEEHSQQVVLHHLEQNWDCQKDGAEIVRNKSNQVIRHLHWSSGYLDGDQEIHFKDGSVLNATFIDKELRSAELKKNDGALAWKIDSLSKTKSRLFYHNTENHDILIFFGGFSKVNAITFASLQNNPENWILKAMKSSNWKGCPFVFEAHKPTKYMVPIPNPENPLKINWSKPIKIDKTDAALVQLVNKFKDMPLTQELYDELDKTSKELTAKNNTENKESNNHKANEGHTHPTNKKSQTPSPSQDGR